MENIWPESGSVTHLLEQLDLGEQLALVDPILPGTRYIHLHIQSTGVTGGHNPNPPQPDSPRSGTLQPTRYPLRALSSPRPTTLPLPALQQ